MMSEEEMKNGDILLKIFLKAGKPLNIDTYDDLAEEQGIDNRTLIDTRENMISYGFMENHGGTYYLKLTPEGREAAKLGIKKYHKQKNREANKGHRLSWINIVVMGLIGLATFILAIILAWDYLISFFK